ncbi:hypothetical protein FJ987_27440 [Mesorhizobium sp. CU2]|uniref:DUF6719 family protein n=1 Tax=unclassified Mesorhizobium TaxID=325217 RepID=UPI00112C5860|nr:MULTISPECIES: DUF6719 family protein [unclassified Mesorhizobium]TPN80820.1 hypothetical protein FJ988_20265 [Mesorhizobium sp. CU3]TPO03904.1 hypothetical protein FJ987_27440 [Mesorhizobium sp. CU2]
MRMLIGSVLIGMLGVGQAYADVQILRHEPGRGQLRTGQTVLVDDGTCPKGQIKEVKAGSNRSFKTGTKMAGSPRTHRCIARY